ncbi:unnamed protein product [Dimorphilus gyrociliatus]|uniref:Uncharacterized protein n=1 Tax=Dimorphilus gyrociliatus TaxID=2664684 RepID=A0A7I8W1F8_9ANNE|nr:unnamed protein product [Dimorphilus gyrociliatus]
MRHVYRVEGCECVYQAIYRQEKSDNAYYFGEKVNIFQDDVQLTPEYEYIRVSCQSLPERDQLYFNFHALIHVNNTLEQMLDSKYRDYTGESVNIIMIGIDSVSRSNMIRQMPLTRKVLKSEIGAVELLGYNKVGENTLVNLVPMLHGKFVEELGDVQFDNVPFIWRMFNDFGYRTSFAEDHPKISIFNFRREGFDDPPANYYLRPLALAMEDQESIWTKRHCVGSLLETERVLDYQYRFLRTFRQKPFFSFSFITRMTHDDVNLAGNVDKSYATFLSKLKREGFLENAVLFFFSDHGIRFGEIRRTTVGRMEERMPFMFISHMNKLLRRRLEINALRLSTPFDIYETLKETFNDSWKSGRGHSLFHTIIPENRTCVSALVSAQFCLCGYRLPLNELDAKVYEASNAILKTVNTFIELNTDGRCALFKLDRILYAGSDDDHHLYVAIDARPRDAETVKPNAKASFEASYNKLTKRIVGKVERINSYVLHTLCVNDITVKDYCLCWDSVF